MFEKIADLEFTIESSELLPLSQKVPGFTRKSTIIKLSGQGQAGLGEDVTYDSKAQEDFQKGGRELNLAGSYTIKSFSDKAVGLDLFKEKPTMPVFRHYRQWGLESAALSLALKQAGTTLDKVLSYELKPLNFAVSKDLSKTKDVTDLEKIKKLYPIMRFKVDVGEKWDDSIIARLLKLDAIDVFDFKAYYKGTRVDRKIKPELYQELLQAFPDAFIEDPAVDDKTQPILEPYAGRVTWDAPLHSLKDVLNMPFPPKVINIKPSRFGSLRELFKVYDYCLRNDIGMYGGGQFELGHGRRQIQYLASLFHAASPNDVAPGGFNKMPIETDLPTPPLKLSPEF